MELFVQKRTTFWFRSVSLSCESHNDNLPSLLILQHSGLSHLQHKVCTGPCGRSKVWEALDREIGEPGKDCGQMVASGNPQPTTAFHNGKVRRDLRSRLWTADVDPVLACMEILIMRIGGWKTDHVFRRYDIVDNRDLADAMAKLAEHQARTTEDFAQLGRDEDVQSNENNSGSVRRDLSRIFHEGRKLRPPTPPVRRTRASA